MESTMLGTDNMLWLLEERQIFIQHKNPEKITKEDDV